MHDSSFFFFIFSFLACVGVKGNGNTWKWSVGVTSPKWGAVRGRFRDGEERWVREHAWGRRERKVVCASNLNTANYPHFAETSRRRQRRSTTKMMKNAPHRTRNNHDCYFSFEGKMKVYKNMFRDEFQRCVCTCYASVFTSVTWWCFYSQVTLLATQLKDEKKNSDEKHTPRHTKTNWNRRTNWLANKRAKLRGLQRHKYLQEDIRKQTKVNRYKQTDARTNKTPSAMAWRWMACVVPSRSPRSCTKTIHTPARRVIKL